MSAVNAAFPPTTDATGTQVLHGVSVTADKTTGAITIAAQTGGAGSTVTVSAGTPTDALTTIFPSGSTVTSGTHVFDSTNTLSYNSSTSVTVYDSLGNGHTLGMYFVKTADTSANTWDMYTSLDGSTTAGGTTSGTLIFNSAGALDTTTTKIPQQTFTMSNGAFTLDFPLDLTGSTQYGSIFGVNRVVQDGYTSGSLAGLSVSPDGVLQGRYTNGQTRNLAQIVLFKFPNPNGLMSLGGNQWQMTSESGPQIANPPNTNGMGSLQAASIEESNVDLTAQLVNMITAQRAYQANAQTIKTEDQLMQTLVNLR